PGPAKENRVAQATRFACDYRSERVRVLDRENVGPAVEAAGQCAGPGDGRPDACILDELVGIADIEDALLRGLVLHTEGEPGAVLVGQARRAVDVIGGGRIKRDTEAQL